MTFLQKPTIVLHMKCVMVDKMIFYQHKKYSNRFIRWHKTLLLSLVVEVPFRIDSFRQCSVETFLFFLFFFGRKIVLVIERWNGRWLGPNCKIQMSDKVKRRRRRRGGVINLIFPNWVIMILSSKSLQIILPKVCSLSV